MLGKRVTGFLLGYSGFCSVGLFRNIMTNELAISVGAIGIEVKWQVPRRWRHDVHEVHPPAVWGAGVVSLRNWPRVEESSVVLLRNFAECVLEAPLSVSGVAGWYRQRARRAKSAVIAGHIVERNAGVADDNYLGMRSVVVGNVNGIA